jgi:hypothetical protein
MWRAPKMYFGRGTCKETCHLCDLGVDGWEDSIDICKLQKSVKMSWAFVNAVLNVLIAQRRRREPCAPPRACLTAGLPRSAGGRASKCGALLQRRGPVVPSSTAGVRQALALNCRLKGAQLCRKVLARAIDNGSVEGRATLP